MAVQQMMMVIHKEMSVEGRPDFLNDLFGSLNVVSLLLLASSLKVEMAAVRYS